MPGTHVPLSLVPLRQPRHETNTGGAALAGPLGRSGAPAEETEEGAWPRAWVAQEHPRRNRCSDWRPHELQVRPLQGGSLGQSPG